MATKKEIEVKLKDALEELSGMKEIYKDGITKKELRMMMLKGAVVGLVIGVVLSHLVL